MKNSRVSFQNKPHPKDPQGHPHSRIASLKAIMSNSCYNQTKEGCPSPNISMLGPRSTRHSRPKASPTSSILSSTLSKLKAMMNNETSENQYMKECEDKLQETESNKMEIEDNNEHLHRYLYNF